MRGCHCLWGRYEWIPFRRAPITLRKRLQNGDAPYSYVMRDIFLHRTAYLILVQLISGQ